MGHFQYHIVDPTPAPPMPSREFRFARAVELFYDLLLSGAEENSIPPALSPLFYQFFDFAQVSIVFKHLNGPIPTPYVVGHLINAPAVLEVFAYWYYSLKMGRPICFVTGLGGAAKSSTLALSLMLFSVWANSGLLADRPFRALVLGPRISSLQSWITTFDKFAFKPDPTNLGSCPLLKPDDPKFVRLPPDPKVKEAPMKDLHSTMDLNDRQRRKAIMKAIARNPRASPFIALMSIGTARGLFADLDAFSEWRQAVDVAICDEAQQDGHVDSCAAQSRIPASAQLMYLGDGRQQPHIGNPARQGSRKATAHLEASKATLRGNVLPLPIIAFLQTLVEAGKAGLDPSQRARASTPHDPLVLFRSLRALLQTQEGIEAVRNSLRVKFPHQELSLLLTRSYRLPYPAYLFYLVSELYQKAIPTATPLELPDGHPAKGRGWNAIQIGHISSAQALRVPLRDPYDARIMEFQVVQVQVQHLKRAGVKLVATADDREHPYLEAMTWTMVAIAIWDMARNAHRITNERKYTILTTHKKLQRSMEAILHGPQQGMVSALQRREDDRDALPFTDGSQATQQSIPSNNQASSLWDRLRGEHWDQLQWCTYRGHPLLNLVNLLHDLLSGEMLWGMLRDLVEINVAQTATGETKGCVLYAGWINNIFACKSFTTNVGVSRGEYTVLVAAVDLGAFSFMRRLVNLAKSIDLQIPGTCMQLSTSHMEPAKGRQRKSKEVQQAAQANCKYMLETFLYSADAQARNTDVEWEHPNTDIHRYQDAFAYLFQTRKSRGWMDDPMGIAVQFRQDGHETVAWEKIFVRDYILTQSGEIMAYTRGDYLLNDIFQHSDYAISRNRDWMLRIKRGRETGVTIQAKHGNYGQLLWWLSWEDVRAGKSLMARWTTKGDSCVLKLALPAPTDVLHMTISEAHWPFHGTEATYIQKFKHQFDLGEEEAGIVEVTETEEHDQGDLDGQAFGGQAQRLLDDEQQIQAFNNYKMVCRALLLKNSQYTACNVAVVNSIKDLKVGEPMIVDINVHWAFDELRQMYLIPRTEELINKFKGQRKADIADMEPLPIPLTLIQGLFDVLSQIVQSVVRRFDFANAIDKRYKDHELALAGGSTEALLEKLNSRKAWDQQILLAIRNCYHTKKAPCLVQLRRGPSTPDGRTVVGAGEMRLRLHLPSEGVVQFAEHIVNATLPDSMAGRVEFPTPCIPSGRLNEPAVVPYTPWEGSDHLPLVESHTHEGGKVLGVTRNTDPTQPAHKGIEFIIARQPLDLDIYQGCLRSLGAMLHRRIALHSAKQLLLRNEPFVRSKVTFGELSENCRGKDETPAAFQACKEYIGDMTLAQLHEQEEWVREAFSYESHYLNKCISQINLEGDGGRRQPIQHIPGSSPFNRLVYEPMFPPPTSSGKRKGT